MTGYDQHFKEWKPKAQRLREGGSTPQEICTKMAYDIFNDRTKYNTVKGWYQRTFSDWPSEEHKTKFKEHRPLQNGPSHQQPAGHLPKKSPACFPPQQRQSFSQHEPNYASQRASSANPNYRPIYSQRQAMGEALPPHATAIYQPVYQNNHYPLVQNYPQITSPASYDMFQLADTQGLPNGLNLQLSPGQYDSPPPPKKGPGHISDGSASQLSIGAIGPPHQQVRHRFQQNGYFQQARNQANEGGNPIGHAVLQEPNELLGRDMNQMDLTTDQNPMTFEPVLGPDLLYSNCAVNLGHFGGDLPLPLDGQQFPLQSNAPPKQSVLAYDGQRYHPSQLPQHQSTSQATAELFATSPGNDQIHVLPSHEHPSSTLAGQHRPTRASNKHYRSFSILSNPTPPPQYPLPADPPTKFKVMHKGPNAGSNVGHWRPVCVKGGSMVTVDPDGLPTDHPPKRVKGVGTRSHDSMVIHPEYLKIPHLVAPGTPASYVEQDATARVPLSHRPVNSSNVSVHSSLRDSGYISMLDSTIAESMQSSFSALKLTDAECRRYYEEADDGYVDVEITTKGRMRRSYIEKMHSPIFGPDS
ncbi:hypothetical protein B0J14DRAFT_373368 [Halenospora varia]|nr:hypothetical protein B0J14DRAFT_373368 [Halenospora varia]